MIFWGYRLIATQLDRRRHSPCRRLLSQPLGEESYRFVPSPDHFLHIILTQILQLSCNQSSTGPSSKSASPFSAPVCPPAAPCSHTFSPVCWVVPPINRTRSPRRPRQGLWAPVARDREVRLPRRYRTRSTIKPSLRKGTRTALCGWWSWIH